VGLLQSSKAGTHRPIPTQGSPPPKKVTATFLATGPAAAGLAMFG
jgi:hypothetical protein